MQVCIAVGYRATTTDLPHINTGRPVVSCEVVRARIGPGGVIVAVMSKITSVLCAVALLGLAASDAQANGRFPTSTGINFTPGQTQTILVPVTFGLLISNDGGTNWDWVCEAAIGYAGTYDPDYTVAADGSIFATNFEGVRVARAGDACNWEAVPDLATKWVSDIERGSDGRLWAVTATGGESNDVLVSSDNGVSFVSSNLPRDDVWFRNVKVAPSDPDRIYVAGTQFMTGIDGGSGLAAVAFRSENGGQTWTQLPTDTIELYVTPQLSISAVAQDDPDTLFARSERANIPLGDVLYRSTDKGQTWTEIIRMGDVIRAVLPRAGGSLIVGTLNDGVRVSANYGTTFSPPTEQPPMNCLGVRSDGVLFACGLNWAPSFFAIATSSDGQTWTPMMRFCEIREPLQCAAGTIQADTCAGETWDMVKVQVAVGDCDAPPGGDAGLGFADASASGPDAAGGPDAGTSKPPDDCGSCNGGGSATLAFVCLVLLGLGRRRRSKDLA